MGGGGGSNKQPNVGQTKISENVEARAVDEASSIKKELDSGQTEIIKAEAKEEGSSIKKDLDSGQTKIMDTAVTSREMSKFDPEMSSFKPITSEQLRKLFSSFKVEYPAEDPLSQSFVHQIIQDGMLRNLVTAINSLSKGIDLSKNLHTRKHDMPTVEAYVFEVDVVYDRDQFRVIRKDASSNEFFIENEDYLTRVILIKSKSLPVIDAKLMVYKKYKHVILKRRIILQHEYEEIDEVAKCIAYQILSSFCCFVESVRNAFKIDLRKIISDYPDKFLHVEKIKRLCLEAFENIADEAVVPLERKREWKQWVADKIKRNILAKGDPLCPDAWTKIRNICRKTLQDLTTISKKLEELKNNVLPVDQNKQIDEWLKREVIKDKASLYPSIIKCIAGQRGDKNIVKVYLSGGNTEEAKEAIKKECKLAITDFEFVNIEEITEMLKDVQKIKALEREAPEIDIATREDLERIIRKHTDKLYASYSNIIGIRIGRRVHGDKLEKPCIIFYCLDKSLIPFGEKKIPDSLEGWPCDVREDFIMLGCCTENCRSTTADYPELGCSIGRPSDKGFGSVGFMFESEDSKKYGFLTAAHVAIENYQQLHTGNNLLSEHPLRNKIHDIVHPSWTDNEYNDYTVGQVMEAFYGNYTSLPGGLDFAAIKTNCKKKDKEDIEVFNEDKTISSKRVRKTGRTTGLTFGLLSNKMESICFEKPPGSGNRLPFYNLYVVKKIAEEDPLFFKPGDSGSGVFVVEDGKQDKALGIGIAIGIISQETYVCKIANILKTLGLKLVRYREDNQEQTLPSTKEM